MAKTTEQLLQQAVQIRDEQANKKNTALRVGTLFSDIIEKQEESDQTHASDVTKINESINENKEKLTELEKHVVYNINKDNDDTNYTLQEALNKIPSEFKTICRAIIYKDSERDGKTSIAVFDSNAYSSGFTTPENWSVFNYSDVESIINQLNIKLSQGDLFYMDNGVNKDGTENATVKGTPYILIDKNYDVSVKASEAGSTYSPLNWYDKDLIFISNAAQGSAGVKEFTIQKADIPENAVYMRSSKASGHNNLYVKNGDISYDRLTKWISVRLSQIQKELEGGGDTPTVEGFLYEGDLFFTATGVNKDGTINDTVMGTPFILLDKNNDLEVKASEAGSTFSPLNFYDDKFVFISNKATGTAGTKIIKVSKSEYPTNAKYIKCSRASASVTGLYVKNGQMSYGRLVEAEEKTKAEQAVTISNLDERVTALENPVDNPEEKAEMIKAMAEKYDAVIAKREMYLRQKYQYDKVGRWYGVTWKEEDNPDNVTDIFAEGCEELCNTLPIQNKMKRCVIKDGVLQYYLHPENTNNKADGSPAKLDGTDGFVYVEIPEFFYKFEVSESDGVKTVKLMISEDGIDGFNYSPKHYVGAYYASLDRSNSVRAKRNLATVCTTKFSVTTEELKTEGEDSFISGNAYSLGQCKLAERVGFTENASLYRGGHPTDDYQYKDPISGENKTADYWDSATDALQKSFCLNKLGVALAQVKRSECRSWSRMEIGETMFLYDSQKALWILSSVEFKTRNIQKPINSESPREGGLGWGATVYPNYDAYEAFFAYRGTACIPNGVTNVLGNNSGQVYYKMPQVPVEFSGSLSEPSYDRYADVYIPVMSYRGVENYYGHLYATADQVSVICKRLDGEEREVKYYYQRNPFRCKTDIADYEFLGTFNFQATIKSISGIMMGFDGHVLPIQSILSYDNGYCDCTELIPRTDGMPASISFNGRLASHKLVGRNFIVSSWKDDESANRGSESVRQCQFIL